MREHAMHNSGIGAHPDARSLRVILNIIELLRYSDEGRVISSLLAHVYADTYDAVVQSHGFTMMICHYKVSTRMCLLAR